MKALTFVLGMAIVFGVIWIPATPTTAKADSLIGGWVWVDTCTTCYGSTWVNCPDAPPGTFCSTGGAYVCHVTTTGGTCEYDLIGGTYRYPCIGDPSCESAKDTHCSAN